MIFDQCSTCAKLHNCYTANNRIKAIRYQVLLCPLKIGRKKPNTIESIIDNGTSDKCIYVGDGKFWLKIGNRMRNPDFIIENSNKILEIFGDYWHRNDSPDEIIQEYESIGYNCLIIWEHEIIKDRNRVFRLIQAFENQ